MNKNLKANVHKEVIRKIKKDEKKNIKKLNK
jgi:hypothetical protein